MNKKSLIQLLFISISIVFLSFGCEKAEIENNQSANEKLLLKEKLAETASVLENVLNDEKIVKELSKTANSLAFGDRTILFEALLDPQSSEILNQKKLNLSNAFSERFKASCLSKGSNNFDELVSFLIANKIELYFPYAPGWDFGAINNITIAPHPITNDEQGPGIKMYFSSKNASEQVVVNDDYALNNPTIIIKQNSIEPRGGEPGEIIPEDPGSGSVPAISYFDANKGYEVRIKEAKLTNCMHGLFGGGAKIAIYMADAEYVDGHFEPSANSQSITFTRWNAIFNQWKDLNVPILSNWSVHEEQVPLLIFEVVENYSETITLNGKVKFAAGVEIEGVEFSEGQEYNYTYSKKCESEDNVLCTLSYFRDNFIYTYVNGCNEGERDDSQIFKFHQYFYVTFDVTAYPRTGL